MAGWGLFFGMSVYMFLMFLVKYLLFPLNACSTQRIFSHEYFTQHYAF